MTELLFYGDSYLKNFTAQVTGASEHGISLDRTAFTPAVGDSPAISGYLNWGIKPCL